MVASVITTEEALQALVEAYRGFSEFAFDVETLPGRPARNDKDKPGLDTRTNVVFWLSLAGPGRSDTIPMGHPLGLLLAEEQTVKSPAEDCPAAEQCVSPLCNDPVPTKSGKISRRAITHRIPARYGPPPEQLRPEQVWSVVAPLFHGPARKIGHNTKFDAKSIGKYLDRPVQGPLGDTQGLAHLVDENEQGYTLGDVTKRTLAWEYDKSLGKAGVQHFPFDAAALYSRLDALVTWLCWQDLSARLERQGKALVAVHDLECEVLEAVIDMERAGAPIDVEAFEKLERDLDFRMRQVEKEIEEYNGGPINLNADRQVAALVYGKRGYEPKVFTAKTHEPSVAAKALEPLAYKGDPNAESPVIRDRCVAAILEHAGLKKIHSTYLVNNLDDVVATGRLYGSFDQHGTKTGRFVSKEPNLQNVPIRKGKEVRDLFRAPPGWRFIIADYSQVELRVMAHCTQDPMLLKAYREGLDLHTMTARAAYGVPEHEEPTSRQRSLAKNVNFSVAYMGTAYTIVTRYEVPEKEAQKVVDGFYKAYRKVEPWQRKVIQEAKKRGRSKARHGVHVDPYVETLMGRRRRLPDLLWPRATDEKTADQVRKAAERQAVNAVIQGTAADMMKAALVDLYEETRGTLIQPIITVHDEVVVLAPEDQAEDALALVTKCMEGVNMLDVPLIAEGKIVERWSDAK